MNAASLTAKFGRMGARLQVAPLVAQGRRAENRPLTLDVKDDEAGEFFEVRTRPNRALELEVADVRRRDRHLLLRAEEPGDTHYYLCGHDELHWFVAAVPEAAGEVRTVDQAMEALKPAEVIEAQRRQGLKGKDRNSRKNAAFLRQGEWFFLPAPNVRVDNSAVLPNEPLSRGIGSKPHQVQYLFRKGGERVHVSSEVPRGLTDVEYRELLRNRPRARNWNWWTMQRNPEAYAKGAISHPDHKTIHLHLWHKVVMNTEGQSKAMQHVVFLD